MHWRTLCLAPILLLPSLANAQASNSYNQSNLVSDGTVQAQQTDPNMINPWGVAIGQQTPFWINAAGTGLSEVYDSGGNKQFVVTIPAAANAKTGSPTGIAFNASTTDFLLKKGGSALFIFDSLDGVISAWNASLTNAQVVVDNSAAGAVYTGLAIANNGTANYILAANFAQNSIDVFDNQFASISLTGGHFVDPALPPGYAPFNVHVLGDKVYVMYDQQTQGGGPPTTGAGAGYVSVFDTNGKFLSRAISGGSLNAPWGLARLSNTKPGSTTYTFDDDQGASATVFVVDTGCYAVRFKAI